MFWKHCSRLKNPVLGSDVEQCLKKIPWNTQKTPKKHVLRLLEKFLKIRFSAQKCGSQHRFRTMLKYFETLRKHQLNMFWGFLRNFWKSGSRLKKSGSRPRCRTMLKILWNTQKTPTKHVLRLFKKFLKIRFSAKKIRFSAQMSNNAKNTLKHSENTN